MKRVLLFVFAMSLLVVTGCSNTVNSIRKDGREIITDRSLARQISVQKTELHEGEDGFLRAQVIVYNTTSSAIMLNYRFIWLDENNMQFNSPLSIWSNVIVKPGDIAYINGVAPSKECRDFIFSMQKQK